MHTLDLLPEGRGEIVVTGSGGAIGLLRQHRQRRLQAMREIAGRRARAPDHLLALVQQLIQIGDERLHFYRVAAFEAAFAPVAQAAKPRPQLVDRAHAAADLRNAGKQ